MTIAINGKGFPSFDTMYWCFHSFDGENGCWTYFFVSILSVCLSLCIIHYALVIKLVLENIPNWVASDSLWVEPLLRSFHTFHFHSAYRAQSSRRMSVGLEAVARKLEAGLEELKVEQEGRRDGERGLVEHELGLVTLDFALKSAEETFMDNLADREEMMGGLETREEILGDLLREKE